MHSMGPHSRRCIEPFRHHNAAPVAVLRLHLCSRSSRAERSHCKPRLQSSRYHPSALHSHCLAAFILQLFALPAVGKVLAVVAVALPIVMVGGLLYRKAAGDCSWPEALGRTYSVLNNCPGKWSAVEALLNLVC